jgi:uridylate kinase
MTKKRVLVKITGEAFDKDGSFDAGLIKDIARQVKELSDKYYFAFVTGAGNIFRGNQHGKALGLEPKTSHQIGMIATMVNGLILKDVFRNEGINCNLLSALHNSQLDTVKNSNIEKNERAGSYIIFVAGTGNQFFSTDTAAILRGLQINADVVWKATNVDGAYEENPSTNPDAKKIEKITYLEAIEKRLGIMDLTAFALAEQHHMPIRIFDIRSENALIKAANDETFGSLVY